MQNALAQMALAAGAWLRSVRFRGLPRLFYTTAPLVFGPGARLVKTTAGIRIFIDVRDYHSCMMIYGRYQPELVSLLERLVEPGDTVLDVGAQLGYITSFLAARVGSGGHIYAFEPDPKALEQLRKTVAGNRQDQVTIFPLAASDREGELSFFASPTVGWSTAVDGTSRENLEQIRVPASRIDDLDEASRIKRPVRLIKLDVEGWECEALDGMQKLLARDRPYVVTELAQVLLQPCGHTTADLLDRIVRHGYRVYRISETRGVLAGGRFELTPMVASEIVEPCDALCVPDERSIPDSWLSAQGNSRKEKGPVSCAE